MGREFKTEELSEYEELVKGGGFSHIVAHNDYLTNLASKKDDQWEKSKSALIQELNRCKKLGIYRLVLHPGSHGGAGMEHGIKRIAIALREVLDENSDISILLETTAGQGNSIGYTFEQLAQIIEASGVDERLEVCFDTCHVFAAQYQYDIRTKPGYDRTIDEFDRVLGLDRLTLFHLNDSKRGPGTRVDRHEHIGWGYMGLMPFRLIMNDRRFINVPKIIETPKEGDFMTFDRINIDTLSGLIEK